VSVVAPDLSGHAGGSSRPKAPGTAALSFTVILALLVALIGIQSRSTPPPTVAQFAPQAVKQIKEAPKEQSSRFGEGDGKGVDGQGDSGGAPPTTIAPDVRKIVTRRCVGDPPRQIEDSQSPPCVAFWQGNNGGATWKGVTGSTIKVAVPKMADNPGEAIALQNFFNDRFEFYGRKLELFDPKVANNYDATVQRNDAASVDSQGAFASTTYTFGYYYASELARRKIMSVTAEPFLGDKFLDDNAPYA
jgi:hypothetical protein